MIRLLSVVFLLVLLFLGGCKDDGESLTDPIDTSKKRIVRVIDDTATQQRVIDKVDSLGMQIDAYYAQYTSLRDSIILLNADYTTTEEEIGTLYKEVNRVTIAIASSVLLVGLEIKDDLTEKEWKRISSSKGRVLLELLW